MTAPQDTAGLKVPDLSTEHAAAFLTVCAEYFERRPTDGEDAAHWANVSNGAMCRKIAAMFADRDRALAAEAALAAERERCAKIAELDVVGMSCFLTQDDWSKQPGIRIAAAIRRTE